ncbi:DUF2249 domain-containing protein [Aquamicrobium terrae]|uniref:Uncharacterized protein (DUF2249 family) n=1 Tax=Aquamicrobium terrae TaxID=1324945 RepID=A0ABV2N182_9HYPH
MTDIFVDLDVRPILRDGGEPLSEIIQAVEALAPHEGLRLLAPFKPVPLFQLLGNRGFSYEAREIGEGDWEVLFHRSEAPAADPGPLPQTTGAGDADGWPEPVRHMDSRDREPPEPMVLILAALETMEQGEVLSALLCREPIFLLPELTKRGHAWRGGFEPDGTTYRILVRNGGAHDAAA